MSNNQIGYTLARLSERSTWLGLIGIASAFGVTLAPDYQEPVIAAGVGLASLIGIITQDKK